MIRAPVPIVILLIGIAVLIGVSFGMLIQHNLDQTNLTQTYNDGYSAAKTADMGAKYNLMAHLNSCLVDFSPNYTAFNSNGEGFDMFIPKTDKLVQP